MMTTQQILNKKMLSIKNVASEDEWCVDDEIKNESNRKLTGQSILTYINHPDVMK